jgi:peptidoglycan/LPS O-acetylase OafA/YrhL
MLAIIVYVDQQIFDLLKRSFDIQTLAYCWELSTLLFFILLFVFVFAFAKQKRFLAFLVVHLLVFLSVLSLMFLVENRTNANRKG